MFLIYAIPGLFNPSLNIILTHFWDEIILWEAVEIIVEITYGGRRITEEQKIDMINKLKQYNENEIKLGIAKKPPIKQ